MLKKYFGTDGIRGRVNSGNINIDGMLRAGLHYNLYEKLTKDLDYKTYTDFDNLPINLEELSSVYINCIHSES